MTNENEEQLLTEELLFARKDLELAKQTVAMARIEQNKAEAYLAGVEQAVADYFTGSGLLKFEAGNVTVELGKSYSVDVETIDAVPEAYIRTKVVKEVDKQRIRDERPAGNFYVMKESNKITVRSR
jgi:hypothetical protein